MKNRNEIWIALVGVVIFILISSILVLTAMGKMLISEESRSPILSILQTLRDGEFIRTICRTLTYTLLAIIIKISLSIPLAISIQKIRSRMLHGIFLLPWIMPPLISALAWLWLFYDIDGGLNRFINILGFSDISWLGNSKIAFIICLLLNVWREVPLWAWVIAPSLSAKRDSLEKLAEQDTLDRYDKFKLVFLPRISPSLISLIILSTIWTFGEFETIWTITRGGPGESTEILSVYAFRQTFLAQNIARGASSFILFLPISISIITILVIFYKWSAKRSY